MNKINQMLKEPIKAKIIEELMRNKLVFSELLSQVGLRDHGQLNYHLKQLIGEGLIQKDEKYSVTDTGEKMGIYIKQFKLEEMYPLSVVCAIIPNHKGELLMVKRAVQPFKGYYAFPGGKLTIGETIFDATKREILEETQLLIKPLKHIGFYPSIVMKEGKLSYHVNLLPVLTEKISEKDKVVISEEHSEYKFININELHQHKLVPGNIEVLKDIEKENFVFNERVL